MLSRLKGTSRTRAGSQSSGELGGPSPRKSSREEVTFVKSGSLSPDRTRTSRSNSVNSSSGNRRKSGSYGSEGGRYSVGGSTAASGIGQGSLTIDQIQPTFEDEEPETPTASNSPSHFLSPVVPDTFDMDQDRTPIPSPGTFPPSDSSNGLNSEKSFHASANSNSSPSLSSLSGVTNRTRSTSSVSQRPQIYTSQAVGATPKPLNGLSALAGINVPIPASAKNSPVNSRSGSVNSRPDPDPVTKSTTSSRKSTLLSPPVHYSAPMGSTSPTSTHSMGAALTTSLSDNSLYNIVPPIKRTQSAANLGSQFSSARTPAIMTRLNRPATTMSTNTMGDEDTLSNYDAMGDFYDVDDSLGTGYAVASSKRNADFHALFKNISEEDYLIEGLSFILSVFLC